jgi:fatty acid desaturase
MPVVDRIALMPQAEYAKHLRPLLPPEAFKPDRSKILIQLINVAILICGWVIARDLDQWRWPLLYLPFALVMGNAVTVLIFSTHEMLHSGAVRNPIARSVIEFFGWTMSWIPPTYWKAVHHREHHNKTNSLTDPDRNYLQSHPVTWGKQIHHLFAPSSEVNLVWFAIGMTSAWAVHTFRNVSAILLANDGLSAVPPVCFKVSPKERRAIAVELSIIFAIHLAIVATLSFDPLKLLLAYFLPIWIGYAIAMFYIYTNHLICEMTEVNDPLINSVSLRVPKILDLLHCNFSYHTEHHVFPSMNSNYAPELRELLQTHYPDRFNLIDATEAWRMLLNTPRHYQDATSLTDWSGETPIQCPLLRESITSAKMS